MVIDTDVGTKLASHRVTLAQVNLLLYQFLDEFNTDAQKPWLQSSNQAHRPLEAKLLLNEKLISEFLYFPQAPKGTTTAVLLSSVPYCIACKVYQERRENGEVQSLYKDKPFIPWEAKLVLHIIGKILSPCYQCHMRSSNFRWNKRWPKITTS